MDLRTVTADGTDGGEPPLVAVITVDPTETGNGYLDVDPLATLMVSIPEAAASVVLTTGPTSRALISLALDDVVAVTVSAGTDAVKLVADGMVVSTLDRNQVLVVRLPAAVPTALVGTVLRDAAAGGLDRIHLTDLTSRVDASLLRFLDPVGADSDGSTDNRHHGD